MRTFALALAATTSLAAMLATSVGAALPPAATDGAAAIAAAAATAAAPKLKTDWSVADAPAAAPMTTRGEAPSRTVTLSAGTGQIVRLARPISGIFVADDKIADVQVKSPTQIYLFAKGPGVTSIYATDKAGAVVWSSDVRVGANLADVGGMLRLAMPEAQITATPISGMLLLTGLVLSPRDAEEAQRLTEAFLGANVQVLNHLKVATPQQVQLQVRMVEVSRSVARNIGVNLLTRNGGSVGIAQGNAGSITTNTSPLDAASGAGLKDTIYKFTQGALGTTLGFGGIVFGRELLATLNLAEQNGLVSTLAEPNLVALSGETASFLAGGEIPVPQSQGLGAVSVEFKQYGVSLSFTPTVLADGRISLHVRPEVSQLSDAGSVKLNGFTIPALTTRRVDTTVELGSGQSFAIGGLLQNDHNNSTEKAPFLGDLPVLGALFRSNSFRKQETELVVVVTPYIVKPVDASQIALPTDGYRSATTVQRILTDRQTAGQTGTTRPMPQLAPGAAPAPRP